MVRRGTFRWVIPGPYVWLCPTCLPPPSGKPAVFVFAGAILSSTESIVCEWGLFNDCFKFRKLLDSVWVPVAGVDVETLCATIAAAAAADCAGSINGLAAGAVVPGAFRSVFFFAPAAGWDRLLCFGM